MKARRRERETFEEIQLKDAEKVDEAHVHGRPWNRKDDGKRGVDLKIAKHEFQLAWRDQQRHNHCDDASNLRNKV